VMLDLPVALANARIAADGTIERLGRKWLATDLEEGQVEHVPTLRTQE
jgi:hypothetical protein